MAIITMVMVLSLNLVASSFAAPCEGIRLYNGNGKGTFVLPGVGKFDYAQLKALGFDDTVGLDDIDWGWSDYAQLGPCEIVLYAGAGCTGSSATLSTSPMLPFWSSIKAQAPQIPIIQSDRYNKGLDIKSVELVHKPPLSCEGDAGASQRFDFFMCESYMCTTCGSEWCTEHCQEVQSDFPTCRCNQWPTARTSYSGGDFAGKGKFGDVGDYA